MKPGETGLPLPPHPGAFGVVRAYHIHEGIDLYCPAGTSVYPVEAGIVVAVISFTGPAAGSDWWHDTQAVLVEGPSGVVVYGEIEPDVTVGQAVDTNDRLGHVVPVLKTDKGRPMSMLHLELHSRGIRDAFEWKPGTVKPPSLRDPTRLLLEAAPRKRPAAPGPRP